MYQNDEPDCVQLSFSHFPVIIHSELSALWLDLLCAQRLADDGWSGHQ